MAVARRRGIEVSYTPDVLDDCVADHAMALLLATSRRIVAADRYVREGRWIRLGEFPLSTKVSDKQMGIVGLGRIGRAIARRAEGFGMALRYHARRPVPSAPYGYEPSLRELAKWADFLLLACPGGPATRHLVNASVLEALGPQGILINIARGSVVDEEALIAALTSGRLGGAGLDVTALEPGAPEALRSLDSVVLTPHIASATHETRAQMAQLVVDNVARFLQDGRLLTPIP